MEKLNENDNNSQDNPAKELTKEEKALLTAASCYLYLSNFASIAAKVCESARIAGKSGKQMLVLTEDLEQLAKVVIETKKIKLFEQNELSANK